MDPEPDEARVAFDYQPLRTARSLTRGLAVAVLAIAALGLVVVLLLFVVSWVLGVILVLPFVAFFGTALYLARDYLPRGLVSLRRRAPPRAPEPDRPYLMRIGPQGLVVELDADRPVVVAWRHVESIDVVGRGPDSALALRLAPAATGRGRPPLMRPFAIRFRDMDTDPAGVLGALRRYAAGRVPVPATPPDAPEPGGLR